MKKIASLLCATAVAIITTSSFTFAADAVIGSETVTVADSFDTSRFYISGFVGAGFTDDADFEGVVTPPGGQQNVAIDFDTDVNFGGAVGIYLPSHAKGNLTPRLELELSHLSSDADTLDFSGNGAGAENNTDGDISRTLLIANAYVDLQNDSAITPFVGVGAGVAFTDIDVVYGGPVGAPPPIAFDDTDTNFAAQVIVGASIEVSQDVSAFVDGRYTRVFDVNGDRFNPGGFTGNIEDDVSNLSANIGLRVDF